MRVLAPFASAETLGAPHVPLQAVWDPFRTVTLRSFASPPGRVASPAGSAGRPSALQLYEALDWAARGKVKVVAETYPLADIARAYDRVKAGEVRFRAVIIP